MIYEYAVDPDTVFDWNSFNKMIDHFGVEHGRLISELPGIWKKMVYRNCEKCGEIEKLKIVEKLRVMPRTLSSGRDYNPEVEWLENAVIQHLQKPFHAIISTQLRDDCNKILTESQLDSFNPLWDVPRERLIPKKAESIVECIQMLIKISKKIKLIDPYFCTDLRYLKVLQEILSVINKEDSSFDLEIHTKEADFFSEDRELKKVLKECRQGVTIHVYQWETISGNDKFHARYILSDYGGVRLDSGLDEGKEGEYTDISLLPYSLYKRRDEQFDKNSKEFRRLQDARIK